MMTEKQIVLVKNSWKLFRRMDPQLIGDVFYSRLFQQKPSFRPMFKVSMNEQYGKIVDMLSLIIAKLDRLDAVSEDITQLALRHVQYGVRPAYYKIIGDALLWTLEKGLGKDWNEETAQAWATCYKMLSDTMIEAAYGNDKK
jgi:hemoglobin-like flavoprotein